MTNTAFNVILSSETVHVNKQTLPSSPKNFGNFEPGMLLEDNGLFPLFEPETKSDQ